MNNIATLLLCLLSASHALAQKTEVRYLSGTGPEDAVQWQFWCSDGMKARKWGKIHVPSCWEQEGYGGYTYGRYYIYDRPKEQKWNYREHNFTDEYGIYRHTFSVPANWNGRQVSIVFDGVMTDAEVRINGQLAGAVHQGGFYQFAYDISDKIHYGKKNQLEVTVHKQSADKSVNAAERRADWWLFGGIFRPVSLVAKPRTQIDHAAIDARADGTLSANLSLRNIKEGMQIELSLAPNNMRSQKQTQRMRLSAADNQTIYTKWQGVKAWDLEHPNLYLLTMRLLSAEGKTIHETSERIGFRTIEFRQKDGIYLNGTKLLIKGTNRHCFEKETGRTVSKAMDLKDIKLIKQMNMNAVRSHYPPDAHFLNLCDSLGLLYLYELCGWQNSYSTEVAQRLLPEMIHRDVNHPCIFLWGNGNEGGWNTNVDHLFAKYDPQHRHVVHPWADFNGLNTRHYPNAEDYTYSLDKGNNVFMMTEFLHGLYDRGQGAGLAGLWAKFRRSPLFAGGFLWAYVDEAVYRTDTKQLDTYGPNAPDGIVGVDRQPEGSFYTVREVWSPIQIPPMTIGKGFGGELAVENNFLFSNLSECTMKWRTLRSQQPKEQLKLQPLQGVMAKATAKTVRNVMAEGNVTLPDIAPDERGKAHFDIPADFFKADILELEAYTANGDTLMTWTYPIKTPSETFMSAGDENSQITASHTGEHGSFYEDEQTVVLSASGITVTFSKQTGLMTEVNNNGSAVQLKNGPVPVGMKAKLTDYSLRMDKDTAVYIQKFVGATDSIVWRMAPNGRLGMDALVLNYRARNNFDGEYFDKPVYNLGFSFDYPETEVKGMTWMGNGPYRVWKNRINGTQLGIWQKDYNNTITGEYDTPVVYPEFKGYHANLYWAKLQTATTPLTVYSETDNLFFRVFTPEEQHYREGRGHSVKQYPQGDLSFLLEIPAVDSKGADGNPSNLKINKGDQGFRIKLWFDFGK